MFWDSWTNFVGTANVYTSIFFFFYLVLVFYFFFLCTAACASHPVDSVVQIESARKHTVVDVMSP